MKNIYVTPEAKLLCFVSAEKLAANDQVDFDQLPDNWYGDSIVSAANDIDVGFDLMLD